VSLAMQEHPYHESLGGSWWCLHCHAPASIEDPGEYNPLCGNCGKRRCEFRSQHAPALIVLKAPTPEFVPEDAQPMMNVRRLPRAERPSLTDMATKGYWLCQACQQPTKRDEQQCCVLCGSSQVEFQEPTL
jgi:Zn finger protein HypA/HybF involved in hydrogenase expression